MENKVYYGEYSLKHWIHMLLKQNIVLPDYQRSFVWDETRVEKLVKSFTEKQFVPPVTIGSITLEDGTTKNIILDGQQRLTSVILAYLGLFPKKDAFKSEYEVFFNDNDDEVEQDEESQNNIIEWTFRYLLKMGNQRDVILTKVDNAKYKLHNFNIVSPKSFFDESFLGFSFLIPSNADFTLQQKYYSTVFRDINIEGVRLIPQESRKSLYFLNNDLPGLFEPKFCGLFRLNNIKLDLVRYLGK